MAWSIANTGLGDSSFSGSTGGSSGLKTMDVDLYQPESWDAWRKFQTGTYYNPTTLTNLINNTVMPGITDRMNQRIAEANRASGPMPIGGTSAYASMMRDRAIRDAMKEESSMRSQLAYDWYNKSADKAFEALGMQPVKKALYRDTPASAFSGSGSGSWGSGGNTIAARKDVQLPFNTANMGWGGSTATGYANTTQPTQQDYAWPGPKEWTGGPLGYATQVAGNNWNDYGLVQDEANGGWNYPTSDQLGWG